MNSTVQIYEFMGCIYAGIIMGVVYGVTDFIIVIQKRSKAVAAIVDGVYLLVCFFIAVVSLYKLTYGRVALYHFVGFALGAIVYILTVHRIFMYIFKRN